MNPQDGYQLEQLVDSAWTLAVIRVLEIIEEEMANTSANTGHGKAQRSFGNKILERLKKL